MKDMRVFGSVEQAKAALSHLEQTDSKATADLIVPGAADARARLEQAKLGEQDIISGLNHLGEGRALLILDASWIDMLRMNDLLGPFNAAETNGAWTPGVGHLEDEAGAPPSKRSEL
jgi:hypothetical protein